MADNLGNIVDDNLDVHDNLDGNGSATKFGTSYEKLHGATLDTGYDSSADVLYDGKFGFGDRAYYEDTSGGQSSGFWLKGNNNVGIAATNARQQLRTIPDLEHSGMTPVASVVQSEIPIEYYNTPEEAVAFDGVQMVVADSNQPNDTLVIRALDSDGLTRKFVADDLSTDVRWD